MKRYIALFAILMTLVECKPTTSSNPASEAPPPAFENHAVTDSTLQNSTTTLNDSIAGSGIKYNADDNKPNDQAPLVKASPKICDPNFTKLASPKRNHHVYYVSNFTSGEFKCWIELEEQGAKICNGAPCVVYFVDNPRVKVEPGSQDYMSPETLRSSGIGRYEYNGKTWEIKGAGIWNRAGKSYTYYNTDNY